MKQASPALRKPRTASLVDSQSGTTMRLQRFLAQAGLGSRRKCEEIVVSGRITVDGERVDELGVTVDPARHRVCLDGEPVRLERKCYYLLNKPVGYLCTHRDPEGRPQAVDLIPSEGARLFTVGRLDENSRGMLLVTNDGELAHRLAHPRFQVERRYEIQVAGRPTRETLDSLKQGLYFADGHFRVRGIRQRKVQKNSTFLEIVLTEGRNREIRRLFARVGHKVLKLTRVGFGPLRLGHLKEGEFRPLSERELKELQNLVTGKPICRQKAFPRTGKRQAIDALRRDKERGKENRSSTSRPRSQHSPGRKRSSG